MRYAVLCCAISCHVVLCVSYCVAQCYGLLWCQVVSLLLSYEFLCFMMFYTGMLSYAVFCCVRLSGAVLS